MDQFIGQNGRGKVLLDLGCGSGRAIMAGLTRGYRVIGVDISQGQIDEAHRSLSIMKGTKYELIKADMRSVPLEDGASHRTLSIASLHHLPDRVSRISALREALRLTADDGMLLVSVWSWDQDRFRDRYLSLIRGDREADELDGPDPGDTLVPWNDGVRAVRFYHLYGHTELDLDVISAGWSIIRSYFDGMNHWVEARTRP